MNIVIAGAGEVGLHVARVLAQEGHDLTIVDLSPEAIERAEDNVDALTLRGNADSPAVLREARTEMADLFIALTQSGAVNLIAGLQAREIGARRVVARVSEQHYFEDSHGLYPGYMGLDLVVNEEALVAKELRRLVRARTATVIEGFADHHIEMVQLPIDDPGPGVDKTLDDIALPAGVRLAGILRRDTLLVPNAADMVHVGDDVVCVGPTHAIPATERVFSRERRRFNKRTVIVGGGGIGYELARALDREGTEVVIVERRQERCEFLSHELRHAQVVRGDGTDLHLLEEYGAARADVFCAVSQLDEVNLMAALLARDLGVERCITLVHKPDYVTVCRHLGLHHTVSPRLLVAREIIRSLRHGHVVHSATALSEKAVVLEVQLLARARATGQRVRDLTLPRGVVLCAHVAREGGGVTTPAPDTVLAEGDHLVIFARVEAQSALDKLFRRPLVGTSA